MKTLIVRFVIVISMLLAGVSFSNMSTASEENILYQVTNLSSLGGTSSAGNSINNKTWVAGYSNLPGNTSTHATLWRDESILDLGTLGGPNSAVLWPVKNNNGVIAGVTETSAIDPLGEAWSCSFFFPQITGHICIGFVWKDDVMTPLPTLGGNHGFATGVNNRGQVVGWAENTVEDPTCNSPQVLQFRAVIWGPDGNVIQQLPPFPGDTVSSATAINDKGQVVGISGICSNAVGGFSAAHALMWEKGKMTNLGTLGGVAWNTPMAINDRGDVVGFSNISAADGDTFNAQAFYWNRDDGIQPIPLLPGHALSQALGINNKGQVVGLSCGAGFSDCRAFLWQDGVTKDLNDLIAPGYADHLIFANDINDDGEISGAAFSTNPNEVLAYVAIPTSVEVASSSLRIKRRAKRSVVLPKKVRQMLMQRTGIRNPEQMR